MSGWTGVIHCAARTGPWGSAAEYERVNVAGLETMVRAAMAAGVQRFVHVSSITVHGNDVRGAADEDSPLHTEPNPYSRSKVAGERLLHRMIRDEGAPVTIVRPGWIYGPGDTASFGRFAQLIDEGRMIVVGTGRNHLPLVYVRDAAEGLLLAAATEQSPGRTYLLVNDEPVTQRQFLDAIAAELNAPPPRRRIPYRAAVALGAVAETAWPSDGQAAAGDALRAPAARRREPVLDRPRQARARLRAGRRLPRGGQARRRVVPRDPRDPARPAVATPATGPRS